MPIPAISSLAFVTVCIAITGSIDYGAVSLLFIMAGFGNAVLSDDVFAPTPTVAQCSPRSGSLSTVAKWDLVALVVWAWLIIKSIGSLVSDCGK